MVHELRGEGEPQPLHIVLLEMMHSATKLRARLLFAALALGAHALPAQQLGYKLLGGAGIDAGVQASPGFTLMSQSLRYDANQLRDRQGNVVPIGGLDISGTGSAFGVSYTGKPKRAPYLSFALGIPVASIHVNSDAPAASLNGYGFADLFVQPIKVGWRERRFDVVAGYMVYIPTGHFEPKTGVSPGQGYWTHQLSAGGALYLDSTRGSRISALASYDQNTRTRDVDVRRGNMFQVQGGAGVNVRRFVMLGVAGYALWQVTPDRGTDIPPSLLGQRSRVYGVGPEVDVTIPSWRVYVPLRVEQEFGVTSRPKGRVIALGVYWHPSRAAR